MQTLLEDPRGRLASFYSDDQPRAPAGTSEGGQWVGGAGGTAGETWAAPVRNYLAKTEPPTAAETSALANHLRSLTTEQLRGLRADHGVAASASSASSKAVLVGKLREKFAEARAKQAGAAKPVETPKSEPSPMPAAPPPKLYGTDKQVAYAESVRSRVLRDAEKYVAHREATGHPDAAKDRAALTLLKQEASARYWIDGRNDGIGDHLESMRNMHAPFSADEDNRGRLAAVFAEQDDAGGHWITIGAEDHEGGTPVFIKDGVITKGPADLTNRRIDNLKAPPPHPSEEKYDKARAEADRLHGEAVKANNAAEAAADGEKRNAAADATAKAARAAHRKAEAEAGRAFQGRRQHEAKDSRELARKEWGQKAKEIGHKPEHLHALAAEMRTHDKAAVDDRLAMLQDARKQLKNYGYDARAVAANSGNASVGDWTKIPHFDSVAQSMAWSHPGQFSGHASTDADAEQTGNAPERLWDLLLEGNPRPMHEEEAYRQALDELSRHAPEKVSRARGDAYEGRSSGMRPAAAVEDVPFADDGRGRLAAFYDEDEAREPAGGAGGGRWTAGGANHPEAQEILDSGRYSDARPEHMPDLIAAMNEAAATPQGELSNKIDSLNWTQTKKYDDRNADHRKAQAIRSGYANVYNRRVDKARAEMKTRRTMQRKTEAADSDATIREWRRAGKMPDGRKMAEPGDKVSMTLGGAFGLPAYVEGEVVGSASGRLKVKIVGGGDPLGIGSYGTGKTVDWSPSWSVKGDPELDRRKEARAKAEADKQAAEKAAKEDQRSAERESIRKSLAAGEVPLKAGEVKPGDVITQHYTGSPRRMVVTEINDRGDIFARDQGEDKNRAGGFIGNPADHTRPVASGSSPQEKPKPIANPFDSFKRPPAPQGQLFEPRATDTRPDPNARDKSLRDLSAVQKRSADWDMPQIDRKYGGATITHLPSGHKIETTAMGDEYMVKDAAGKKIAHFKDAKDAADFIEKQAGKSEPSASGLAPVTQTTRGKLFDFSADGMEDNRGRLVAFFAAFKSD